MLSVKTSVNGGFALPFVADLWNNENTKMKMQTKAIHKTTICFFLFLYIDVLFARSLYICSRRFFRRPVIISLFIFVIFLVFGYKKAQTIAIRFTVHHKPSSNMGCLRPYGCSPNIDDMLFLLAVVIVKLLSNMSWTRVSPIRIQKYKISLKDRRNYPNLSSNVSTL